MARLRKYLGLHVLRVLAMPPAGGAPERPGAGLRFAALSEDQALAWAADPELDLNPERVRAAYARGDVCVGVRDGDTPAGYIWYAYGPTPHLAGVWVECGPRARYSYKSYVRPSHRGRGIAAELYRQAYKICPQRGRDLSLLAIDLDNRSSLRASLRAGRRVVGYAGFLLLFGRVLATFRSPGAKKAGFRFFSLGEGPAPARAGYGRTASPGSASPR